MRINTNIVAKDTFQAYTAANNSVAAAVKKLSSGNDITCAADNAAGLAISEKMEAQIRGLDRASANGQDAISLVQTAEGSLESAGKILQRMREIAVQSASDTNEDEIDREALQAEFNQLQQELDEIAEDSTFNNQKLLDGSLSTSTIVSGSKTSLSGTGMNVSFGKANAGIYDFSVKVVKTQAEQTAAEPKNENSGFATSTLSSSFSAADVAIGANAAESAILNGNYTLSATYDSAAHKITVKATGDNGLTFTKELTDDDIGVINKGGTLDIDFGDTAFKVTLTAAETLVAGTEATTSEMSALAGEIGGTFTIGGGKDAVAAKYAVMASLTGAVSVELKAGMDSVTFDNGVTVSFEKLTAADLDTTAERYMSVESTLDTITVDPAFENEDLTDIGKHAISTSYSITAELNDTGDAFIVTAKGNNDDVFTATVASTLDADEAVTLEFKDSQGNAGFTLVFEEANSTDLNAADFKAALEGTSFVLTQDAAAKTMTDYNFEKVFGATSLNATGTADTGVSHSTIEAKAVYNDGLTIQVGANTGDELSINIDCASSEYLGVKGLDVSTQASAAKAIDRVNKAISQVSSQRAYLGAIQNRLENKISNLETSMQNLTSASSSIKDVDMAEEMTEFTNDNILSQASTAMLAQANSLPQNVLSLLG